MEAVILKSLESFIGDAMFEKFSLLRKQYKSLNHPYLSVLEGEMIKVQARLKDKESNVVYWGTTSDKLNKKWILSGFSLKGLIDKGYLIYGDDRRNELLYPQKEEMLKQVDHLIGTIRIYAQNTTEDIHSIDWLFLISQSLYWLKTLDVTGKTTAAKWLIKHFSYPWLDELSRAIEMRQAPELATRDGNKTWLKSLGKTIQQACDDLEKEKNKTLSMY